ncbi:MAG: sugar ABC transporter permease [Lachnospiraceae bacterium]|nr:sugar ABC transporter permease [Lachnospiraceae bacterium]
MQTTVHKKKRTLLQILKPYLFLLPIYVLMVTFKYIPFGMAIKESFFNWNGANVNQFIGIENYLNAFKDPNFLISLINCGFIAIADILIVITFPILAAELLYAVRSKKSQYIVRTTFTFPMVVPGVVIILLWKWILAGDNGVLNTFLSSIGLDSLTNPWLGNSKTALASVVAIGFPWLGSAGLGGLQFLLYYGALQATPKDMLEASQIDGANIWQRFWKIDLPMLSSQIKLTITLAIINAVQVFDTVYILTKGGPGTATLTPSVVLYEQGFTYKKMGYSSAIGVIMFAIIIILTILNQKFMKNTEKMD